LDHSSTSTGLGRTEERSSDWDHFSTSTGLGLTEEFELCRSELFEKGFW